jgi:protoheme ferro-lyase
MLVPDNVERSNRVHHLNLDEVLETMSPKGIQNILLFVLVTVFSFYTLFCSMFFLIKINAVGKK